MNLYHNVKRGGHYFTFRAQKFAPCASLALFEISTWNFLYRLLKSLYTHIFQKNWEHLACARVSARVIRRLWLYRHFYWNDRIKLFFHIFQHIVGKWTIFFVINTHENSFHARNKISNARAIFVKNRQWYSGWLHISGCSEAILTRFEAFCHFDFLDP